jgi:hypothetical protein
MKYRLDLFPGMQYYMCYNTVVDYVTRNQLEIDQVAITERQSVGLRTVVHNNKITRHAVQNPFSLIIENEKHYTMLQLLLSEYL